MERSRDVMVGFGGDARALCRRTWWVFLVGGLASIAFGVLAFAQPDIALLVLAMFFAAMVAVDGAFHVVGALRNRTRDGWWLLLLLGVLGVLVGGYVLLNPPVGILAFVFVVAFQAIFAGVFLVALGWKVRKSTSREWLLYLTGALSILAGALLAANPAAGGLSIVWIVAAWAIATGVLRVWFAVRVKNLPDRAAVA
jgi:uncharacterized membrane protein HdeD (DUF308 family)